MSGLHFLIVFLTFRNGQADEVNQNQKVFRISCVKLLIWPCGLFPLSRITDKKNAQKEFDSFDSFIANLCVNVACDVISHLYVIW